MSDKVKVQLVLFEEGNRTHTRGKQVYQEVLETHSDQANFDQFRHKYADDIDPDWEIEVSHGTGYDKTKEEFKGHATAKQVEQAMWQIHNKRNLDGSFEKRILDSGSQETPEEETIKQILNQENQELVQRISKLESQLDDTKENVNQNAENIEAIDEKTDRMIERFTEVSNQIIDRLDEIGEKQDSGEDNPEQIRNPRE